MFDNTLNATGDAIGMMGRELEDEIAALRVELNAARVEIKAPQRDKSASPASIVGWKIDRIKYRAIPFYADGKPGMPINLRPLFEMYHEQTNG